MGERRKAREACDKIRDEPNFRGESLGERGKVVQLGNKLNMKDKRRGWNASEIQKSCMPDKQGE